MCATCLSSDATRSIPHHLVNRRRKIRAPFNMAPLLVEYIALLSCRTRAAVSHFPPSVSCQRRGSRRRVPASERSAGPPAPAAGPRAAPRAVCLGLFSDDITGPDGVRKSCGPKNGASLRPISAPFLLPERTERRRRASA